MSGQSLNRGLRKQALASRLPSDGTQQVPRIGDVFTMQYQYKCRDVAVVSTEWDDQEQELTITLKPVLVENEATWSGDPVVVQDTNPYKEGD